VSENTETVRRGFDAFSGSGEPDWETLDPDVELINFETFPVTRRYRGHEGVIEWLTDMSEPFDEFRFELVDVLGEQGDNVVGSLRASGKSRTGGPPFNLEWACVYTFRNGKAIRIEGFRTSEEALAAAGVEAR
jgi:ketosteroid isomerase-like protein